MFPFLSHFSHKLWNFYGILAIWFLKKAQKVEIKIMEKLYHKIQDFRADILDGIFVVLVRTFCAVLIDLQQFTTFCLLRSKLY